MEAIISDYGISEEDYFRRHDRLPQVELSETLFCRNHKKESIYARRYEHGKTTIWSSSLPFLSSVKPGVILRHVTIERWDGQLLCPICGGTLDFWPKLPSDDDKKLSIVKLFKDFDSN